MQKAQRNYIIYALMLLLFGTLIYLSVGEGMALASHSSHDVPDRTDSPFDLFLQFMQENLHHPLAVLLLQIIVVLLAVRFFSYLFKHIHQPGVIGEIVAGIVLGPS